MQALRSYLKDALREASSGGTTYHVWMGTLTLLMCAGAWSYSVQLTHGLSVTGMHDHVSWGFYISNFAFLVGVAAAAVILVMPSYILHDMDFKRAVLIGEAVAVSAVLMAIAFVVVDVGGPGRLWHAIPMLGLLNFPRSLLAWDILVLNGYLLLNLAIPFHILFSHYQGREPDARKYLPFVMLSIAWAVALHLVTAFLFSGLPARPYWNASLLGPRFLATAFTAGPALIILILVGIRRFGDYPVAEETIAKLAMVLTVAAQICCVMTISEIFTETYRTTHHSHSAKYLFFGLHGKSRLVPWIWTSIGLLFLSTGILSVHRLRRRLPVLLLCCVALFAAIEIEKGMGTIIPGFIPEPWGKVDEYQPTWVEFTVGLGIAAMGAFVFSILAKVAIAVETSRMRLNKTETV